MGRNGPSPLALTLAVGQQVSLGLVAAHAQGLVHRDIKPANLWLEPRPTEGDPAAVRVRILDFGLARPVEEPSVTQPGLLVGTPGFVAPELVEGEPPSPACDLFSLGCVLYRMATGRSAFTGKSGSALLLAVTRQQPPAPASVNPNVPVAFSELIASLLAKQPSGRPASAQAVAELLGKLDKELQAGTQSVVRPGPAISTDQPLGWSKRHLAIGLGAVAMTLAVLALLHGVASRFGARDAVLLKADLALHVWKNGDLDRQRELTEPGVLPLRAGDYLRVEATANRPAYLYLIHLVSEGKAIPMYPWERGDWSRKPTELPQDRVRVPSGTRIDMAPLTESLSGMEAWIVLAREEPLSNAETQALQASFADVPRPAKADLFPQVAWLADSGPAKFGPFKDRGALDLEKGTTANTPVGFVNRLLQTRLPELSRSSRAICYPFRGKD